MRKRSVELQMCSNSGADHPPQIDCLTGSREKARPSNQGTADRTPASCNYRGGNMKIIRAQPTNANFTVISNAVTRDPRLSYRARGILIRLLGNVDGFSMDSEDLASEALEGRTAVQTALRELRKFGYLVTKKRQDERGRWITETIVSDLPISSSSLDG